MHNYKSRKPGYMCSKRQRKGSRAYQQNQRTAMAWRAANYHGFFGLFGGLSRALKARKQGGIINGLKGLIGGE